MRPRPSRQPSSACARSARGAPSFTKAMDLEGVDGALEEATNLRDKHRLSRSIEHDQAAQEPSEAEQARGSISFQRSRH